MIHTVALYWLFALQDFYFKMAQFLPASHLICDHIEKLWPVIQTTNNDQQEPLTKNRCVCERPMKNQTAVETTFTMKSPLGEGHLGLRELPPAWISIVQISTLMELNLQSIILSPPKKHAKLQFHHPSSQRMRACLARWADARCSPLVVPSFHRYHPC